MRRQITIELVVLLALTSLPALVDAQSRPGSPQSAKAGLPPLVLAEQGSFFVNAQAIETRFPSGNGTPAAGHISGKGMYVQYQIPKDRRGTAYPVVMVHGSSHTAKTYEDTPDGRMGWAESFVRRGVPTYVVDHAGRARSGFDPSPTNQARLEKNAGGVPELSRCSRTRTPGPPSGSGRAPSLPIPRRSSPCRRRTSTSRSSCPIPRPATRTARASPSPPWRRCSTASGRQW